MGCRQAVRHGTLTPAFVGPNPAIPANRKATLSRGFSVGWDGDDANRAAKAASVRIRRPEICKLACKAQGERIFAEGEYPAIISLSPLFSTLKFFEILQMHFGHFGSVDRFEPPQCRGRRLDDPKNTAQTGCRGRQPLPIQNLFTKPQIGRLFGQIRTIEPLLTSNSSLIQKMRYCFRNIFLL